MLNHYRQHERVICGEQALQQNQTPYNPPADRIGERRYNITPGEEMPIILTDTPKKSLNQSIPLAPPVK